MADLRDAKAAKKAKVEAELKDAISTLRKPNREVIGKAIVEAAEKRVSSSLSAKSKWHSPSSHQAHVGVLTRYPC
jgi:DNA replication regulator SLD3